MAMNFPMMGDANNAGTTKYGITYAGLNELSVPVLGSFVNEVWYQDTLTSRVLKTGIPEFKNGGWEATFYRHPRAQVKPYVMGKGVTYDTLQGWTNFTIRLDRSCYGTYSMLDLERAIVNRDLVSAEQILSHMGKSLGDEMGQTHWIAAMTWLKTWLVAANTMATPDAQTGIFYKGGAKSLPTTGKWDIDQAVYVNVMTPFRKARIAMVRNNYPKGIKPYALVSPETMDILTTMEKVTFTVGDSNSADRITRGDLGEMIVSGFQVIQTPWIQAETVATKADQHAIIFGSQEGAAFHRVLDKSEAIRPQDEFADAFRQLSAYGFGMMDERFFGIDWLQIK